MSFKIINLSCALSLALAGAPAIAQKEAAQTTYIPAGYSIETIETPAEIRFDVAGLAVHPSGAVAVATRLGEVWILPAEAAGGTPKGADWRRFATGLGEATGIYWDADDSILVAHKLELTRLIDTDNDGKADRNLNVANGWAYNQNYHEFHFGPVKDSKGNYYGSLNLASNLATNLAKDGPEKMYSWRGITKMRTGGGYRGWAYQVTPEGEFIPFATGFRSPAGVGMSPKDELFITDNQGDWVPTSKLHHVVKGGFYGHPAGLVDHPDYTREKLDKMEPSDFRAIMTEPVVWLPHEHIARSPGNPVWDTTGGKFGPFGGQMFIPEHTGSSVFRVLLEKVGGAYQGAAINFADGFQSANIRAAFDPKGRMWIGQTTRGWGSKGPEPFGVQRLVWDGVTQPFELLDISLTRTGFELTFTQPVKPETVQAAGLAAQQWHYNYNHEYGSPKVDVKAIAIKSVKIARDDKRKIVLEMPLEAGKVVAISFAGVQSADNRKPSVTDIYYTLNRLRAAD